MRTTFRMLITAAIVVALAAPSAVSAASWQNQPGTLTVTVDRVNRVYTYHGTGYDPAATVTGVFIHECTPDCETVFLAEPVNGDGEFTVTRPFGTIGYYTAWTTVDVAVGNQVRTVQAGDTVTFTVPPEFNI